MLKTDYIYWFSSMRTGKNIKEEYEDSFLCNFTLKSFDNFLPGAAASADALTVLGTGKVILSLFIFP